MSPRLSTTPRDNANPNYDPNKTEVVFTLDSNKKRRNPVPSTAVARYTAPIGCKCPEGVPARIRATITNTKYDGLKDRNRKNITRIYLGYIRPCKTKQEAVGMICFNCFRKFISTLASFYNRI